MQVTIDTSELEALAGRWEGAERAVKNELVTAFQASGNEVKREGNAVINRRSGELQGNVTVTTTASGAPPLACVISLNALSATSGA
jgi:hypothetical protein